jgi:hypothetical protein
MKFIARLKRFSATDRAWRNSNRVAGVIYGISFRLRGSIGGGPYETDELDGPQIWVLTDKPNIDLIATSVSVPPSRPSPLPPPLPLPPRPSPEQPGFELKTEPPKPEPQREYPKRRGGNL